MRLIDLSNHNTADIELIAQSARLVFEQNHTDLYMSFRNFPRACCGNVSEFFGKYLTLKGTQGIRVVHGVREDEQSHAWLVINGYIIDLTRDQFATEKFTFATQKDSEYYNQFKRQRAEPPVIAKVLLPSFEKFCSFLDAHMKHQNCSIINNGRFLAL